MQEFAAPNNQDRLRWAVRVRWLVIAGFFALACLSRLAGVFSRLTPCALAAAGATLVNGLNHYAVTRWRLVRLITVCALLVDVFGITVLVTYTGGVLSPFVIIYVVQVVATAMLVGFVPALITAGLSVVSCALTVAMAHATPRPGVLALAKTLTPPIGYQLAWVAFLLYCLALLAFLGGYISTRLRRSERHLAHTNARMRRALSSLRAAHVDLAATYQQLRATEAQLVHDEKMRALGAFVAGIAHELNNPLAVVAANIDHLQQRLVPLHDVLTKHVSVAQQAAQASGRAAQRAAARDAEFVAELPVLLTDCIDGTRRAAETVQSLHAFSRSGATDRFQPADLHAMLDRTLTLIRHRLGKAVMVERHYGAIPRIECLPSQLDQVFLNLLLNAADAVGDRGLIVIETGMATMRGVVPAGEAVTITVRDDGAGIPPEALAHIFDPFFTTKPVGKGAGLGLSVSYGIVQRHAGTIVVRAAPNAGAAFSVTLPVRHAHLPTAT